MKPIYQVLNDAFETLNFNLGANDETTRKHVKDAISSKLEPLAKRRKIYNFNVICDESNNIVDDSDTIHVEMFVQETRTLKVFKYNMNLMTGNKISWAWKSYMNSAEYEIL